MTAATKSKEPTASKAMAGILKKRGGSGSRSVSGSGSKCSFVLPPEHAPGAVVESGFRVKPEVEPIIVKDHNVAKFSLPAEALCYQPPADQIITPFKNGDKERKIHCNTELAPEELRKLCLLQHEALEHGAEFFPSVASMATRFMSRARGDVKRALKLMQVTQEWREKYFKDGPITDESVQEDMRHGIVYFCGRDKALRPTVVVRGRRIPQQWYKEKRVDKLIRVLIFCTEYFLRYMVVPGRVENLNVIFDLKGLGISQVPVHVLGEVYGIMSHHYIGRVFRFYVANMPYALRALSSMATAILTDRQRQKLTVLDNLSKLKQEFAPHQLEQDLGGSLPVFTEYFPFGLQPGPFCPGDTRAPDSTAVPDVHRALTCAGARGRLWDPRRSSEENSALEYSSSAHDILQQCGFEAPAESLREEEQDQPNRSEKIASRDITPRHKSGGFDSDDEDLVKDAASAEPADPEKRASEVSTAASTPSEMDAATFSSTEGEEGDTVRAEGGGGEVKVGAAVLEEVPDHLRMCQAGGFFGLAACWLQPAA